MQNMMGPYLERFNEARGRGPAPKGAGKIADLAGRLQARATGGLQGAGGAAGGVGGAGGGYGGGGAPGGGSSGSIYDQMQGILSKLQGYAPQNVSDIYRGLSSRVGDMKPQYEELRGAQAGAYAAPAEVLERYRQQTAGQLPGAGVSAMGRLNQALQEVGARTGTANVMGDLIGQQRGRLEDLSKTALDQYNAARQSEMDRYQMLTPLYQAAMSREESARNRAASGARASQAAASQREQQDLQRAFMEKQLQGQMDMANMQYGQPAGGGMDPFAGLTVETGDDGGPAGGAESPLWKVGGSALEGWGTGLESGLQDVFGKDRTLGQRLAGTTRPFLGFTGGLLGKGGLGVL